MNRFEVSFVLFLLTFFLWLGLSAYVVLNRLLHDFRLRALREAQTIFGDSVPALLSFQKPREVHGLLARFPRPLIYRVSADVSQPSWVSEALSAQILSRWGAAQLLKEASGARYGGDRWRRVSALSVVTRIRSPQIHELLRQALTERDRDIAGAAVVLLGRLQDRQAAEILVLALCRNWYSAARIATQLDHFKIPLADILLPLVVDASPQVRYWAVSLLARYRNVDYLGQLIALMVNDPDASVRKAVAKTLGTVGGPHAAPTALKLLDDPVDFVRANAARALGNLAQVSLAGSVTPLLADREWGVRLAAREALVAMGPGVRRVVAAQLNSPDTFARDSAAEVLLKLPPSRDPKSARGPRKRNRQPKFADPLPKSNSNFSNLK